jgi:uncharacterized membrane protein
MKIFRWEHELHLIIALSLILVAVIFLDGGGLLHYLRVALGLPFVLFFPGYVLIAALFPKKDDLDGIERTALSFGLSIAVVPLIGLALNYTPWGIRLVPVLSSLVVFVVIMSGLALYRRKKLPEEERYLPVFEIELPVWGEISTLDKVLTVLLMASVLFAVGSICYVVAAPKVGERFTEFYILGMSGKADGYPSDLQVGAEGEVIVGIVNHEYCDLNYYVEIKLGDTRLPLRGPIALGHEQKWEEPVSFSYDRPQEKLKVEFLLYREGDTRPYRSLHLWVNVHEPGEGDDESEEP